MNKYKPLVALVALVLSSLACNAGTGAPPAYTCIVDFKNGQQQSITATHWSSDQSIVSFSVKSNSSTFTRPNSVQTFNLSDVAQYNCARQVTP